MRGFLAIVVCRRPTLHATLGTRLEMLPDEAGSLQPIFIGNGSTRDNLDGLEQAINIDYVEIGGIRGL